MSALALPAPVRPPPRGVLWALGAVVLIGHLVLLQTMPAALAPPDKASTRAFTTRTIVLTPPPPAEAAPPPKAEPVAKPPPTPRPRRPAPPKAAVEPAPPAMSAQPSPAPDPAPEATETTVAATPAPAASAPVMAASEPPASNIVVGPTAADTPAPPPPAPQPAAMALAIPGSVRLKYELTGEYKKQTYHARGELLWLQDGQTYDARLEASAFLVGSRVRTSSGRITDRGLAPTRFAEKWRGEVAAHFERDKGQISFSANTPKAPLLPDVQDQLSVLLQLASMIAGDPSKYPVGTTVTVPVVGPRDADIWVFTMQGDERIYLPTGETATVKLTRNPRKEFDQKVEAWLAPALSYMPVRFRMTQPNGDFVDQQLRAVDKP